MDAQYEGLMRKYKTPFLIDSNPPTLDILEAILQASDFVFEDLAVNSDRFSRFNYDDVVMAPVNVKGKTLTQYKRRGDFPDVPLLVISKELYDSNGEKKAATYSPDDKIVMVSFDEDVLTNSLSKDSGFIPLPLIAGLETISALILFYQDVHLNRSFKSANLEWPQNKNPLKDELYKEATSLFNMIAPQYAKRCHSFHNSLRRQHY